MKRTSVMPSRKRAHVLVIALAIITLAPWRARGSPTVKEVDASIDKAVAYLLAQQKPDGSWESEPRLNKPETSVEFVPSKYATYGGETAIVTYALLAEGQNPHSDPMKKAVAWLEQIDLHGTYAVGLRAQVWNLLPEQDRTKSFIFARDRDRDYVYYARSFRGSGAGFYTYFYGADTGGVLAPGMRPLEKSGLPDGVSIDRSNSQYAVLGAWAVEQAGADVPRKYWEDEDAAWRNSQMPDGSWTYNNNPNATMVYYKDETGKVTVRPREANDVLTNSAPTMTCAGVATLYITQDYMMRNAQRQFDVCNGGIPNANIDRGLAWIDKHFDETMSVNDERYHYAIYGLQRIGVASGRKYIGGVDWFQHGAEALVVTQKPDGSWNQTLHDTAYGILFLSRGRAPVTMNKLIYSNLPQRQIDPWNERPRDAANLASWIGKHSLEGFLNWQLVDLKYPVEQFHDAPILYISGSEPLNLSSDDVDKLRLFVQQGGMILGNADCGRTAFGESFMKLGAKLFPKYEFRVLPADHLIFSEQYLATKWKSKPRLMGMSNGVRELMILIPDADAGRAWQNDSMKIREELYQLGDNIFLYATGKENLRKKGDSYIVSAPADDGKPIEIARLMLGDNPDPEPGGWTRLAAIMQNEQKVHLNLHPVKLGAGDVAKYRIAHWTGTTKIILNDQQRKELKSFVEGGGTLIIDSAGGSFSFANSVEAELPEIFGDAAAKGLATPLPRTDDLFSSPSRKIDEIHFRSFARRSLGVKLTEPRVRGILTGANRIGVFYSREDLSAGLVGEQVDGILGYDPQTAVQLMQSMIMYAENPGK